MIKTISVIGLGRIGLPTAVLFASHGYEVFGCERDAARRELLLDGRAPFHEPGLEPLVTSCIERGDLTIHEGPKPADATVICIGTTNADALFDASQVLALIEVCDSEFVIIESTLPPGTCARLRDRAVAYCPERVAPGSVFQTIFHWPRLVSAYDPDVRELVTSLYYSLGYKNLEQVEPEEAEIAKLAENAFRDANIAFANQLAMTCYERDVDVRRVIEVANSHPNVGIHDPGIGVGGACLGPASRALAEPNDFFEAVRAINESQIDRIVFYLKEVTSVAVFGIGYKPDSDDTRYSPAVELVENLEALDLEVSVWDPVVGTGDRDTIDAGAIVIGCGHTAFRELDPAEIARETGANLVIDFTGALDLERWRSAGFSCIWR